MGKCTFGELWAKDHAQDRSRWRLTQKISWIVPWLVDYGSCVVAKVIKKCHWPCSVLWFVAGTSSFSEKISCHFVAIKLKFSGGSADYFCEKCLQNKWCDIFWTRNILHWPSLLSIPATGVGVSLKRVSRFHYFSSSKWRKFSLPPWGIKARLIQSLVLCKNM